MPKVIDLTGKVFGRWTVVKDVGPDNNTYHLWECRCVCGTIKNVSGHSLRRGVSNSCGCLNRELASNRLRGIKHTEERKHKFRLAKFGTHQTAEHIKHRFEWRKHKRPKPFTAQARANCSIGAIKRILKYGLPYNKNRVEYFHSNKMGKQILCRSGWEKIVYLWLEHDERVVGYHVESLTIPYVFEGSVHQYLPDVLVEWRNGHQELLEIKPAFKLKEKKTQAKIEAATLFALERGWSFNIVDERDIAEIKGRK